MKKRQLDTTEKLLLSFTFVVLLISYVFGGSVRPLTVQETPWVMALAFEPVCALLLRRVALNRKKNPTDGHYYLKVALCLFGMAALLVPALRTLVG